MLRGRAWASVWIRVRGPVTTMLQEHLADSFSYVSLEDPEAYLLAQSDSSL